VPLTRGFAAAALVVNGLMIVGAMSVTQATLTLPGIAGLVLTLAVAVDDVAGAGL